jgi:uncharacterized protein YeaO (DUF488 family)
MLRQASVSDLLSGRISVLDGYIVITMRRYPRFVARGLRHEYISDMAPQPELFSEWLSIKRRTDDHEAAFVESKYESRFTINEHGMQELARLAELSRKQDVFLVCQCRVGQRCHRELLMMLAKEFLGAEVEGPYNAYPVFRLRLKEFRSLEGLRAA